MKKYLLILTALLLIVPLNGQAQTSGAKALALVLKVKGEVSLTRGGKTSPLKFGTPLDHGDVIITGADGFTTIIFSDDKSQLKVMQHSRITLEGKRLSTGGISKRIQLSVGEIFTRIKHQVGPLEIVTPTSVAKVKGTEFWVGVDSDGNSYVTTLEGIVSLLNLLDGQMVEVRRAQHGEVDTDGNLTTRDATEEEMRSDPDPDPEDDVELKVIEINVLDEDGNERILRFEYRVTE
ncbi:MAG: FecR domain-containing protein [Calditrichaeota bacterium]|nr:FecR domain-containing protein [Calditrichota bacterium]